MKAAVVIMRSDKYGDRDYDVCDALSLPVDVPGVIREEFVDTEIRHPQSIVLYRNKAMLNDKGEPYIHSWVETVTDPTYEEWCKIGFDHERVSIKVVTYGNVSYDEYSFARKVIKYRWVVEINTLEEFLHLVENLDAEYEYTPGYPYTPEIAHNFIFEVADS